MTPLPADDTPNEARQGPTRTGLSPRVAAVLAYAAWWVTGALFLIVEPKHPYVRFHARQAILGLGAVWFAGLGFWGISLGAVFISPLIQRVAVVLAVTAWTTGALVWCVCVTKAWRGRRWSIPGLR